MQQTNLSAVKAHHWRTYVLVFAALAVMTLIEFGLTQIPGFDPRIPLLVIMAGKVTLVATFYMHLRSDSRWFAAFFLVPIPFIALMFAALMLRTLP